MFFFRGFTRLEQLKHLIATGQIDGDFYWRQFEEKTERASKNDFRSYAT